MEDLKNLKKKVSIDLSKFDGVKAKIGKVELQNEETKVFSKDEGERKVRQILIETEFLDDDNKITAREYISLKYDKDSKEWVIPIGNNSKASKVLSKFNIENFDELEQQSVVVVSKTRNNGNTYLGINLGF